MNKTLVTAACTALLTFPWVIQAQSGTSAMSGNETVVREFIAAWSNLDPVELAAYFTSDGVYHNIPSNPVSGRENIQNFIAGFIRPWQETEWVIVSLATYGDTVIVERVDKTVVANQPVDLPVVGVFEMADGKIKEWRDYFDLATYVDQLNAALGQSQN